MPMSIEFVGYKYVLVSSVLKWKLKSDFMFLMVFLVNGYLFISYLKRCIGDKVVLDSSNVGGTKVLKQKLK